MDRDERLVNVNKLTIRTHKLAKEYAKLNGMRDDLTGLCAISSTALFLTMKVYGFSAKLMMGKTDELNENVYRHCWVEIGDMVYDPTFLQFDKKNMVYVGNRTDIHHVFKHLEEITDLGVFSTWLEEQKPLHSRLEWFTLRLLKENREFNR